MKIAGLEGPIVVHDVMRIDICEDIVSVQGLSVSFIPNSHPTGSAPYQLHFSLRVGQKKIGQDDNSISQAETTDPSTSSAKSQSETRDHSSNSWKKGSGHVEASPFLDQLQRASFNTSTRAKRGLFPLGKCLVRGRHKKHRERYNRDGADSSDS